MLLLLILLVLVLVSVLVLLLLILLLLCITIVMTSLLEWQFDRVANLVIVQSSSIKHQQTGKM